MQLRWLVFAIVTMSSPAHAQNLMFGKASADRAEYPPARALARAKSPGAFPIVVIDTLDNHVKISRSSVDVREVGDTAVVNLTFAVTASWELPRAARLSIGVPHDANVVGMSATLGGETLHAMSELAVNAREQFDRMVSESIDPALLEWTRRTPELERLALSLHPVSKADHTTMHLTITMPRFQRLLVDVDHVRFERQGGTPVEAPGDEDLALASKPRLVTEGWSLYASPPTATGPSRSEIANYVRVSRPALAACHTAPGAAPSVAGAAPLRFQIGTDGRVDARSISGSTSEIGECVAEVLSAWQFHPSERTVQVLYPVQLGPDSSSPETPR